MKIKINTDLKYPLNNPDGKVSIRYYINTKLKPELSDNGVELYPLYFQLIVKRQTTYNKSYAKNNKMSVADFEKIKDVANSKKIKDIGNSVSALASSGLPYSSEQRSIVLNMFMPILSEKNLIYDIVSDLKPFDRNNFDIKEFNHDFEIYNSAIKSTISNGIRDGIKLLLQHNTNQDNVRLVNSLIKIVDWNKADAYDLWLVMKDSIESINMLMKDFPYCFQIISGININNIPENDIWIIDFFAEQTYQNIKFGLEVLPNAGFDGRSPMYNNPLFDPICVELKKLFFGK